MCEIIRIMKLNFVFIKILLFFNIVEGNCENKRFSVYFFDLFSINYSSISWKCLSNSYNLVNFIGENFSLFFLKNK